MENVTYATNILAVRLGCAMLLVSTDVLHVTFLPDKVHNNIKNGRQRSILNSELLQDISVLYMAVVHGSILYVTEKQRINGGHC